MSADEFYSSDDRGGEALPLSPRPYLDQGRAHLLDILQHLVEYSAQLVMVAAPSGRGKSTLAAEFETRCGARCRVCHVQADADVTPELLLSHLAYTLAVNEEDAASADALEAALAHLGEQVVVVVDDAERLPAGTLALLLRFAREGEDAPPPAVRVALFAEESLELPPARVHRLAIAPFTLAQAGAYIEHRLEVVQEPPALDAAQIFRIHHRTGGNPGDIECELADIVARGGAEPYGPLDRLRDAGAAARARLQAWRARLLGARHAEPASAPGAPGAGTLAAPSAPPGAGARAGLDLSAAQAWLRQRTSVAVGAGGTLIILVLVVLALPRGPGEGSPSTVALTLPEPVPRERPAQATTPPPTPAAREHMTSDPQVIRELPRRSQAETPASTPDASDRAPASAEAAKPGPADTVAAPAPSAQPVPPARGESLAATSPQPARHAGGWLADRDPDHYTLQLAAGSQREALRAYAARQALEGEAALISGTRDGTPWYTLVFGAFPDRAAAETARMRLDRQLEISPWPRRIGSLQGAGEVVAVAAGATPAGGAATATPTAADSRSARDDVAATNAGSAGRGMVWLWAQDQSHYTLQLTASGTEAAVRQLIAREGIERDAAYFTTERDGQPWYVLIYGSYPSAEAARAAVADLPATLREGGPWPRTFASVQRSVRLD